MAEDDPPNITVVPKQSWVACYGPWIALVMILVFVAGVRWRLAELPLERDEGEYAYMGQLILQGIPPYQLAYNMKFPGVYLMYAVIMAIFGQNPAGIHMGVLLVNAATVVVVFLLTRRLWSDYAGVLAAVTYALLSMTHSSLGLAGHATHFVVLWALWGILLLWNAGESSRWWRYVGAGILMGLAIMMKQPGVFFAAFAVVWMLCRQWHSRPIHRLRWVVRPGLVLLGIFLPLMIMILTLWRLGVFDRFWFWTVRYAQTYGPHASWDMTLGLFLENMNAMTSKSRLFWALAIVCFMGMCLGKNNRRHLGFITGLSLFSFLSVCPGLHFRLHYFIMIMPMVAIIVGGGLHLWREKWRRHHPGLALRVPLLVFSLAAGHTLWQGGEVWLRMSPEQACRSTYGISPFAASIPIAHYIKNHTAPQDTIAVLGSEPQIYFYSQRHSATGYIYTYPLAEQQPYAPEMQKEMAREIEASCPQYIVCTNMPATWPLANAEPEKYFILRWWAHYRQNYDLVGLVELCPDHTYYRWDNQVAGWTTSSVEAYLMVLRRKQN